MNAMTGMRGVAAGKFKVGDRVSLHDFPYILYENQRAGTVTGSVAVGRGDWIVEIDNYDDTLQFLESEMALLAPAFRIEAGKYYLTRGGRRVGPAYGPEFSSYWRKSVMWVNGTSYGDDGREYKGEESPRDLVAEAEAPAPAKGNPAAQVDNLADEYGGGKREAEPIRFTSTNLPKPGDRVKLSTGDICTVSHVLGSVVYFVDRAAEWHLYSTAERSGCTLVAPATSGNLPTLIVALIENGQPKPATRPYIHRSRDAATAEAGRLADKHRGQEFGVFELVDTRKVDKPEYEHEWQRLAAEGKKIGAIQALRAQAGLTLYGAKTAVENFTAAA